MIAQLDMVDVHNANWDAVNEYFQLRADRGGSVALVLRDAQDFKRHDPVQWKQAWEVLAARAKEWKKRGLTLRVVFVT
jgi:hypothetical protein